MTQAVPPERPPEWRWREGPHPREMTGGLGVGHRRGPVGVRGGRGEAREGGGLASSKEPVNAAQKLDLLQ